MTQQLSRVIRVVRAYSVRQRSAGEVLALAAVAPEGSQDPVDAALAASLRVNRPDLPLVQVPVADCTPASSARRFSLIHARAEKLMIMRGEVKSVLGNARISRAARTALLRDADELERSGRRCLVVACAEVAEDGTVGEFFVEGCVALALEKPESFAKRRADNPKEWVRVDLWSVGLRFQHWANVLLIVVMTVTGYYIMHPFFGPNAEAGTEVGFLMGWIRLTHYVAGFLWIGLALSRFFLALVSRDRKERWSAFIPLRSKKDVKGLIGTIQYYLFLKSEPPLYIAHNPLQQIAYNGIYVMCILLTGSGLGLYGVYHQTNDFWVFVSYRIHLLGVPMIRLIHSVLMFLLWACVIAHIYMAMRADALERHGGVSSMINGGVWLRRGAKPLDGPEIG